jgi:hypothetical protein
LALSADRPGILQPARVLRPSTAIAALATNVVTVRRGIVSPVLTRACWDNDAGVRAVAVGVSEELARFR